MTTIKINDKDYKFKYKVEDITLLDYLDVIDILNEDEYDFFIDKQGKKKARKEPIAKNIRSTEFVNGLYKKVIQRLSNIPIKYQNESEVLDMLIDMLTKSMEIIQNHLTASLISFDSLSFSSEDGTKYHFDSPNEWCFYKWIGFDTFGKGVREKDDNDNIVVKTKGDRFTLALFADINEIFDETYGHLEKSNDFFLNQMNILDALPLHIACTNLVYQIKSQHQYIYSGGGSGINKPNIQKHNEIFGWMDTLRGLAEKQIFGTYSQTKKANLMEVLEYLNCSISYDVSEYEDSKIKTT